MAESFHPIQLFPLVLWGGFAFAIIQVLRFVSNRDKEEFGLSALALVGWLDIFSFMTGFSIGWAVAIFNSFLGLLFAFTTRQYRPQITFATLTSVLLVLFMRGFLPSMDYVLEVLLVIALIYSLVQLAKSRNQRNTRTFAGACLAVESLLLFLSLVLQNYVIVGIVFAILAVLFGAVTLFNLNYYRAYLAMLAFTAIVWLATIYWQLAFGL